jgi:hypothetical protein
MFDKIISVILCAKNMATIDYEAEQLFYLENFAISLKNS